MSGKPIDISVDLGGEGRAPKSQGSDPRVQLRALELINAERQKAGAGQLLMSVQLNQAAQEHSADMDQRDFMGPITPEGAPIGARTSRLGYEGKCEALVAMGAGSPEPVLAEWVQNDDYRSHLIGPQYQHIGIGMVGGMWTVILATPQAAAMKDARDLRNRVLELINRERETAALALLELSDPLGTAAQAHSADMAKRDYFQTTNPEGEAVGVKAQKAGFPGRTVACLARGPVSPEEAVQTWLKSSRGNLLHPEIRYLGVATTAGKWTLLLGTK